MVSPMFLDKQLTGFKIPYGKCVEKINWILSLIKKSNFSTNYMLAKFIVKLNDEKNEKKNTCLFTIFLNKQLTEITIPVSKMVQKTK